MVVAWPTLVRAKYPKDLEWRDVPCALPRYHRSLPFEGPSVDLHLSRKECHLSKQKKPKKMYPVPSWIGVAPLEVLTTQLHLRIRKQLILAPIAQAPTSVYVAILINKSYSPFMARYWLWEFAENSLWWRQTSVLWLLQGLAGLIQPKSKELVRFEISSPGDCFMSLWIN